MCIRDRRVLRARATVEGLPGHLDARRPARPSLERRRRGHCVVTAPAAVLWRHGRTAYNNELRLQGQVDIPLDTVGHWPVSYTHLRAHETRHDLVCRLL